MKRLVIAGVILGLAGPAALSLNAARQSARPLTIEDYYRVLTVGGVTLSPDGRWVAFTVSTRVEATNGNQVESYLAPADASAQPRRITHEGKGVTGPAFTSTGRLRYSVAGQSWTADPADAASTPARAEAAPPGTVSPDGKWTIVLRDKPAPATKAAPTSDFERRHAERGQKAICNNGLP